MKFVRCSIFFFRRFVDIKQQTNNPSSNERDARASCFLRPLHFWCSLIDFNHVVASAQFYQLPENRTIKRSLSHANIAICNYAHFIVCNQFIFISYFIMSVCIRCVYWIGANAFSFHRHHDMLKWRTNGVDACTLLDFSLHISVSFTCDGWWNWEKIIVAVRLIH